MERLTRILIADDRRRSRHALRALLSTDPGCVVVDEAATGAEVIHLAERLEPDVILMDVEMPEVDGVAATRILTKCCPAIAVIGVSMSFARRDEILAAGARAFVGKAEPPERLLAAIRAAGAHAEGDAGAFDHRSRSTAGRPQQREE
jgi:DNA-binding NarL/FixJ family response regulator